MKKIAIISILFLCAVLSCKEKRPQADEYLQIGGRRYEYKLSELSGIREFTLWLQPELAPSAVGGGSQSLKGIEQLGSITSLTIQGASSWPNVSEMDFSPLNALSNLRRLRFYALTFDKIPDLSGLPLLEELEFGCRIATLDGLEKVQQVKRLNISFHNNYFGGFGQLSELSTLDSLIISGFNSTGEEWEKTVIRAADLSGLKELRFLQIENFNLIDLGGVQNLSSLEILELDEKRNMANVRDVAGAVSLRELICLVVSPDITSLDFLRPLTNLSSLTLCGKGNAIDVTPLGSLPALEQLHLIGFAVRNFQVLDNAPTLNFVYTYDSSFSPQSSSTLRNPRIHYMHD